MNACSALKTIVPDQVCAFVGTGDYVEIPPDCTFFEGEPATYTNLLSVLNQSDVKGLLPNGLTELEYLESSGTQYLRLPNLSITSNDSIKLDFSVSAYSGAAADGIFSAYKFDSGERMRAFLTNPIAGLAVAFAWGGGTIGGTRISYNKNLSVLLSGAKVEINGTQVASQQVTTFNYTDFVLFTQMVLSNYWNALIKMSSFSVPGKCRLIPALRNSDSVVGMWDSVQGKFYTNAGTGTFGYRVKATGETVKPMSLRDPYYTAPSGIYARPSGENELEILADTEETTGDGWEWFANTAEAYEHFNITMTE